MDSLYDGLLERAAEAGVALVGGNVTRGRESIVVDVTLLGDAGRLLLRTGARPGDRVVVTGTLGAAAEGVRLLAEGSRLDEDGELVATGVWTESSTPAVVACLRAQLDPRPPLALARSIAERGVARAGMDLSDGLSLDLVEICSRSGVGAVIEAAAVPVDPKAAGLERARGGDALALALHGGEDYQLLLAVEPEAMDEIGELARVWGVEVAAVGEFVEGEPVVRLRDADGERPLAPGGTITSGPGPPRSARACAGCAGRSRSCSTSTTAPPAWPWPSPSASSSRSSRSSASTPGWRSRSPSSSVSTRSRSWSGAWVNNPWTVAPMYSAGTLLGCFVLGVSPASLGAIDWALHGRAFYASLVDGLRPLRPALRRRQPRPGSADGGGVVRSPAPVPSRGRRPRRAGAGRARGGA